MTRSNSQKQQKWMQKVKTWGGHHIKSEYKKCKILGPWQISSTLKLNLIVYQIENSNLWVTNERCDNQNRLFLEEEMQILQMIIKTFSLIVFNAVHLPESLTLGPLKMWLPCQKLAFCGPYIPASFWNLYGIHVIF